MSASGSLEVLVLCASPVGDLVTLKLPQELIKIEARLRKAQVPVRMTRVFPPTIQQLRHELTAMSQRGDQPGIFHFLGHGDDDGLYFEDELGASQLVKGSELKVALQESPVKLVLLNACWSATKRGVSLVEFLTRERVTETAIGHEVPVADVSAIQFAERFYELVVSGKTLKQACDQARNSLAESGLPGAADVKLVGDSELKLTSDLPVGQHAFVSDDGLPTIGYLPDASVFFGRQEQLLEIARALSDSNLVAVGVWGIGGIGKTALVLAAARRNAWRYRGTAWVDIREATQKTTVELLRLALGRLSPGANSDDPQHALSQFLKGTPSLIVLDNLEDLPESEVSALARFLKQMPRNGSHVLLTARVPLKPVEEVPDVTSIKLTEGLDGWHGPHYVQHVARQKKCLALQDELRHEHGELETTITGLQGKCVLVSQRLHGHPKMLELAVGLALQGEQWLNSALASLPEHLEDQFTPLLATSLEALAEDGRKLLPLLVFFPTGRLTPEALQVVAETAFASESREQGEQELGQIVQSSAWLPKATQQLVQSGLLDYDQETDTYSFHQSIRDIALHELPTTESRSEITARLLTHYADYVETNCSDNERIDRCANSIIVLLEFLWTDGNRDVGINQAIAAITNQLGKYFLERCYWRLGRQWHERAIQWRRSLGVENTSKALAQQLHQYGQVLASLSELPVARDALSESLSYFQREGDHRSCAAVTHELATVYAAEGKVVEAHRLLLESISLKESLQDTDADARNLAASLQFLATIESSTGRVRDAKQLLQRAESILRPIDDELGLSAVWYELARIEFAQGNNAEARTLLQQAIDIFNARSDDRGFGASLHELSRIELADQNFPEARRLLQRSAAIKERIGDLKGLGASLHQMGVLENLSGDLIEAQQCWNRSVAINESIGEVATAAATKSALAQLEAMDGNTAHAIGLARDAVETLTSCGHPDAAKAKFVLQSIECGEMLNKTAKSALEYLQAEHPTEALRLFEQAVSQARQEQQPLAIAMAQLCLGRTLLILQRPIEAIATLREAHLLATTADGQQLAQMIQEVLDVAVRSVR